MYETHSTLYETGITSVIERTVIHHTTYLTFIQEWELESKSIGNEQTRFSLR